MPGNHLPSDGPIEREGPPGSSGFDEQLFSTSNSGEDFSREVFEGPCVNSQSSQPTPLVLDENIARSHASPDTPFHVIEMGRATVSCYYIPRGHSIQISARGLIYDADETQFKGTAEHYHDGENGRFSRALKEMLRREGIDVENELDWDEYTHHAGGSMPAVCMGVCDQANEAFDSALDSLEYQKEVERISQEQFHELIEHVRLMRGVKDLLSDSQEKGLKQATCSASDPFFVTEASKFFGVLSKLDFVHGNAVKKIPLQEGEQWNRFSGDCVLKCVEALDLSPYECAMFGDSLSDIGASLIAGLPITIVRPIAANNGKEALEEALKDFVVRTSDVISRQPDKMPPAGDIALVFVDGFDQVRSAKLSDQELVTNWEVAQTE